MIRRPPISTRTDTLFPYTTLFRAIYTHAIALDDGQHARYLDFQAIDKIKPRLCGKLRTQGLMQLISEVGVFTCIMRCLFDFDLVEAQRSEEHTSELQSLMRISYAVFCLKKKILRH